MNLMLEDEQMTTLDRMTPVMTSAAQLGQTWMESRTWRIIMTCLASLCTGVTLNSLGMEKGRQ